MKGPGLLMLLGKSKGSDSEKGSESDGDYLDEAFDAVKDDDRAGFKAAMKAYVDECMSKSGEDDDEDDNEPDLEG